MRGWQKAARCHTSAPGCGRSTRLRTTSARIELAAGSGEEDLSGEPLVVGQIGSINALDASSAPTLLWVLAARSNGEVSLRSFG